MRIIRVLSLSGNRQNQCYRHNHLSIERSRANWREQLSPRNLYSFKSTAQARIREVNYLDYDEAMVALESRLKRVNELSQVPPEQRNENHAEKWSEAHKELVHYSTFTGIVLLNGCFPISIFNFDFRVNTFQNNHITRLIQRHDPFSILTVIYFCQSLARINQ